MAGIKDIIENIESDDDDNSEHILHELLKVAVPLVDLDDKDPKINQNVIAVLRKTASVGSNDLIEYGVKFMPF